MTIEADALDLPFWAAIDFFKQKINVPTTHWRQVYAAAHSHSFMVSGAATEALVEDFRKEIAKADETGTTLEEFREGFDEIVERYGWDYHGGRNWRSRLIFETNLRSAHAAGRYYELTRPETLLSFPNWMYNHSGSKNPRAEHQAWDGMVFEAGAGFWSTNYPPNGYGCYCWVTPVSNGALERMGKSGPDTPPDLKQAGTDLPVGVSAGFEWNPGQRWLSGGRPGQEIATARQLNLFATRALVGDLPVATTLPIAPVPEAIAAELTLPSKSAVRLSVQTISDHAGRHGVSVSDYANSAVVAMDDLRIDDKQRISSLVEIVGKPYIAGFKVTQFGEFLMTTLRPANPRQIKRVKQAEKLGK